MVEGAGKRFAILMAAKDSEYVKKVYGGYFNVFVAAFGEEGDRWDLFRVVDGQFPDLNQLDEYSAFVVTGSPFDAFGNDLWILRLCFLLRLLHSMQKKILGICFGHQVMAVKKNIEDVQGKDNYPCGQQLLIHNGKVLKDETTLAENKVSEDGFLVVMLSKSKSMGSAGASSTQSSSTTPATAIPATNPAPAVAPEPPQPAAATINTSTSDVPTSNVQSDNYGQAASTLVAGSNLEQTIQQLIDMGGGTWDRDTVTRALRAAYNNPERAVDYLYSGIPETAEVAVPVAHLPANQATERSSTPSVPISGGPNASPLNMFPQEALSGATGGGLGSLDFLRNNQQFQALRSMVQANPQILQPMLQELGKQNPQLLRLIQEHHAEFLQLINEPLEGSEGDIFDQPDQEMPHAINVTPAEQEAIERLEAMGFDRALVIEAFLACDRNEELAANYLLENAGDFED